MKRILSIFLALAILTCLVGCDAIRGILPIREYNGTPLTTLSYKTVDYMGGATVEYVFDFEENTATRIKTHPDYSSDEFKLITETELLYQFTDEAEREFINQIYSYGLFNIKDHYEPVGTVMDGGGWTLKIDFSDGTSKISDGDNAGPRTVFRNCSIPFYDLCGVDVLGHVPYAYYTPPSVDISVGYEYNNHSYSSNHVGGMTRGNYLWNGHEKNNVDIYTQATSRGDKCFLLGESYTLSLYTANYDNMNYGFSKFNECVVMSYAMDQQMSDGREIARSGWFDSLEITYEPNRIYVVTLYFDNGDYVEYAFTTAALDQKIFYGKYYYPIYSIGGSSLYINEDGSFSLEPFRYYDNRPTPVGEAKVALNGRWEFQMIDGKDYLVLTAEGGKQLVFDYCAEAIFLDFDKTTLELKPYNIEGESGSFKKEVSFRPN